MRATGRVWAVGVLLLLASACATPTPSATPTVPPLFQVASAGHSTSTPAPRATGSRPSRPAPPTATIVCTNNASFLEDLTIPDGTQVLPGENLDKRWSVRNSGSCGWGPDYRLARIGTSEIQGAAEIALFPASAGSVGEWQVALQAPQEPGEYLARWQARAPDGTLFGDEVFVLIEVAVPEPTATTSVTPTP